MEVFKAKVYALASWLDSGTENTEMTDFMVADVVKAWRAVAKEKGHRQTGRRRTPASAELIRHLVAKGEKVTSIARRMNLSRTTVYKLLNKA